MGKAITFMIFLWFIISLAGGVMQGSSVTVATTTLTESISENDTTLTVTSTEGFPDTGFIQILDERVGYASKTSTTFKGNFAQPLVRGASNTDATAHSVGERVRTIESAMLNQSLGYKIAALSDASGLLAFVTIPFNALTLLGTFFVLPLGFLGTDFEILTYLWGIIVIGIIIAFGIAIVGGRRV